VKKTIRNIFGKMDIVDWVLFVIPVIILTPFVIASFWVGDNDTAVASLIIEVFTLLVIMLAPTLHDKIYK